MTSLRVCLGLLLACLAGGCSSFSTVTISGSKSAIERQYETIAEVCRSHGFQVADGDLSIPGYNRYANDPRNRVVRAWQTGGLARIHEFWREDHFVVIIYTRSALARRYADEIKARLVASDPNLEVIVEEQRIVDFT